MIDPRTNDSAAVATNGRSLMTWLAVGQWFYLVIGVLYVLGLLLAAFVGNATGGSEARAAFGVILVSAVVTGAIFGLYFLVLGWAREWIGRVRDWASQGREPGVARLDALRGTLGRWIGFFQWLPAVVGVLAVLGALLVGALAGGVLDFLGSLGTLAGGEEVDPAARTALSGVFGIFFMVFLIVYLAPIVVINFLILGAVRRWMNGTTDHLLGRSHPPLVPMANTVSGWFVFCQVLLVLGALGSLLGLVLPLSLAGLGGLAGTGTEDLPDLSALLATGPVVAIATLFSLAVYLLQFLLLEWSKRFSLGVSRLVDGPTFASGLPGAFGPTSASGPVSGPASGSASGAPSGVSLDKR